MLNKEKYMDELMKYACEGSRFAVLKDSGYIEKCVNVNCRVCIFDGNGDGCIKARMRWIEQEYEEPPVDWTKVPVDTPILVKNTEDDDWTNRYFAEYKNETVFAWYDGATSWSSKNDKCDWEYAKLAEREE